MLLQESFTVQQKDWTKIGANPVILDYGNQILLFTQILLKKNKLAEKVLEVKFTKILNFKEKLDFNTN